MTQYSEGIPPVSRFSNDNKQRVVWAHGAVYQNRSRATSPLIDVLLRPINEEGVLEKDVELIQIAVPQLDIVKLGTIWEGQRRTVKIWDKYNGEYKTNKKFTFDFDLHRPETTIFPNEYYAPKGVYPLGKIKKTADYYTCMNSTYTKLVTVDRVTVLIPSMEFFTSTFTPEEQQIRNMLLMNPMDDILDKYLTYAMLEDTRYKISFKVPKSKSNLIFLSYLALNQKTKVAINKLRSSVILERRDENSGCVYGDKYPIVLPYHPKKLSIISDCIKIKDNTFLCLRINEYSLPVEYAVDATVPSREQKENEDNGDNKPARGRPNNVEPQNAANIPIVANENPHMGAGAYRIHSQVQVIEDGELDFTYTMDTATSEANANSIPEEGTQDDIDGLSSGEKNSQDSSKSTASIEIKEISPEDTKEIIKNSLSIKDTINALNELIVDKSSNLVSVSYIDSDAILCEDPVLCSFVGVKEKIKTEWMYLNNQTLSTTSIKSKSRPRGCLIAKLILNNKKTAYLVEIEKKNENESFSGLIFNTLSAGIDKGILKSMLAKILINRGRYSELRGIGKKKKNGKEVKRRVLLDISVPLKLTYSHQDIMGSFARKLNNVILKSEEKNIFI